MTFSNFVNLYSISKTLRFELRPVGKTADNFENNRLLETDKALADNYKKVKGYIDRYHRDFIERTLADFQLDGVKEYAELYYTPKRNKKETSEEANKVNDVETKIGKAEEKMRKAIAQKLKSSPEYKKLGKEEMIKELLPSFVNDEEKEIVESFKGFTTYFTGFFTNRENMYTSEAKSTAIAYRCINDNLPKFLDNCRTFEKIKASLSPDTLAELDMNFEGLCGCKAEDIFGVDYFSFVLTQSGIDNYNQIIGGYTTSDGEKVKGLNEYINLHNQQTDDKLPQLKTLFKQILSERSTVSFLPEKFTEDDEMRSAVNKAYSTGDGETKAFSETIKEIKKLFDAFSDFDLNGIYIKNDAAVTDLSQKLTGYWGTVQESLFNEYDSAKLKSKKITENYEENRRKEYKKIKSFSLAEIDSRTNGENKKQSIAEYYRNTVADTVQQINDTYSAAEGLLTNVYQEKKAFAKNDEAIKLVKDFLDSIKALQGIIKPLLGSGKEADKDESFYGIFTNLYTDLQGINSLYDMVRNYVTKKPYSSDKIKLNFENSKLLDGWDRNKEKDYHTIILRKDDMYYLAVMTKKHNKLFEGDSCKGHGYEKMVYKLLPGPNKMLPKVFFAKSNIDYYAPSDEIIDIYRNEKFKKGDNFNLSCCHKMIDFYKEAIAKHPEWNEYSFIFKETNEYRNIGEFYNDVKMQGYNVSFVNVSESFINEQIDSGNLYLFRIYNKDFSEKSKGKPNLHTLYFKALFDERNLRDLVFKLNGGAEMFYREPSIKKDDIITHNANNPIKNKNQNLEKKTSTFAYDIIKDKRYTVPKFFLHLPITLNFKANGVARLNDMVCDELKKSDDNYIIGIDRGERNLIYICVINSQGEIVEQKSLNEIVSEYNGTSYSVDYHKKLDECETEREKARQNWTTVNNIKELKEGYISQVVHEICRLVLKYNAIIAMEDLNSGFKNSRIKVEKQVYQRFENQLISKLRFLASKDDDIEKEGGILKAYQLTNADGFKFQSQNGIIFFVPAWLTSKIDPVTGFVDLLKPKYTSVNSTKDFIERFNFIRYNSDEDYFEFDFHYDNFPKGVTDFKNHWTVCTYGERIEFFRNAQKNNEPDNRTIQLTEEFKSLFEKHGIDYRSEDLKAEILKQEKPEFFKGFIHLLRLTLQMRNSQSKSAIDYLISPIKSPNGTFYCSNSADPSLPQDADANGAYNIARKALWSIENMKANESKTPRLSISNKEWLEYTQR